MRKLFPTFPLVTVHRLLDLLRLTACLSLGLALVTGCDDSLTAPPGVVEEEEDTPPEHRLLPSFRLEAPTSAPGASFSTFRVTPIGFDFGEVQVGTTSDPMSTTVTNVGSMPVVVSMAGGAPSGPFDGSQTCQGATLDPGDSCEVSFTFRPTAAGPVTGSSSFTLNGEAFSVELSGVGVDSKFLVTPTAFGFGEVRVGTTSAPMATTVTNAGSAPVTVSMAGGAPSGPFSGSQNCQGMTLEPGDSCEVSFTFQPTVAGPVTSSSNFTLNGVPFSVDLSGLGVPPSFLVSPTGHDFGEHEVGTSTAPAVTMVTNAGPDPITVSMAGGAPSGPFSGSQTCQGITLGPGDSCEVSYRFGPTATGPVAASSTFTLNGVSFSVALAGTGIPAGTTPTAQFNVTPTGLDFGQLQVGETSAAMATNVTNVGAAPIVVSMAGGAPSGPFSGSQSCQGMTLDPGESCQISYTFSPTAAGPAASSSNFTVNGEAFSVGLSGTGVDPKFLVTPTGLGFGEWQVGTSSPSMASTVTNVGTAAVTVSIAGGAPTGPFDGAQSCQGRTLEPGASCEVSFTFIPTTAGPAASSSSFSLNGQPFTVALAGLGVDPRFLVTPTGHDFGAQAIGTTSAAAQTQVTNAGLAPVTVSMAGGAAPGDFGGSQSCQGMTLSPGDSCSLSYTFSPTAEGPASSTSTFSLNGQAFEVALMGYGLADVAGPLVEAVAAAPNPVQVEGAFTVSATVTDALSNVVSAEYRIDGGPWTPMNVSDGAYDALTEDVVADGTAPAIADIYDVCVRGTDAAGNTGAQTCTMLVVFDPDGGFVTGAGWFDSPPDAFADDPTLVGRATFAFVSKYLRGRTTPDGSTSFRFRAAGLDFKSDRYDFLIVNQGGTNAQFKGAGRISRMTAPNGDLFRFMVWAGDGDPDTFRIRIWWEDGGTERTVYDNGSKQAIGGGSVHSSATG